MLPFLNVYFTTETIVLMKIRSFTINYHAQNYNPQDLMIAYFLVINPLVIFYISLSNYNLYNLFIPPSMREDRFKLSQLPRTKTTPPSQFSTPMPRENRSSRTSMVQQLQLMMKNSASNISAKIDKQSFNAKYQRALKLINENNDLSCKNALNILTHLCAQIQKLPEDHEIANDFLQKVVINCWRLKNKFKNQQMECRKQCLDFIRHYVSFFEQNYKKRQIHKHGLQMLYLIQANEQYEQKMYKESMQSCEMSLKNCRGTKNQPHFLKVHYLKSKIYASLRNIESQMAEIKKCLLYLNILSAVNFTDANQRQYLQSLKKVVEDRKQAIIQFSSDKKQSLDFTKKLSAAKFRKRSISLKKAISEKELAVKVSAPTSPRATALKIKTIHVKSVSNTKHQLTEGVRKEFLPVDINKFEKKTKLKKKALRLSPQESVFSSQAIDTIMDDIDFVAPPTFNHQDLMLRRPKIKKVEQEIPIKGPITNERQELDINKSSSQNKQINLSQKSDIEPVTHVINQNTHQHQQNPDYQHEMLVKECVRTSEENLFKLFARIHFKKEEVHQQMTFEKVQESMPQQQIQFDPQTQLVLKRQQTSCHQQLYFEAKIFTNKDVKVDDQTQLCTYCGILSDFGFSIKIERMEHINTMGQSYKTLHIDFTAILNKIQKMYVEFLYHFYQSYEKNLQFILDQINQRQNLHAGGYIQSQSSIKDKLFNLISNKLILVKKAYGAALIPKIPKSSIHTEKAHFISAYKNELRNRLTIFELNNLTRDYHKYKMTSNQMIFKKQNKQEVSLQNINSYAQPKENSGQMSECQDLLNFYLPKLMEILSQDLRTENPSLSSIKRFKTQNFYKDTLLSYTNLIKINEQSDVNTRLMYEDAKSMNLVIMPSDFNSKISNFFEHWEDTASTLIPQFYYCMKFLLIKPASIRLNDTLNNFYDRLQVEYLHKLKDNLNVSLKMSCYKIKDIFKHKQSELFFKFQVLFKGEKIKMMKFIATSHDIRLIQNNYKMFDSGKETEKSLKISRKNSNRVHIKQPIQNMVATKSTMLNLLKLIGPNIFVKKDYIYSIIGFETEDPYFCFINKFRLEGKTTQNKNFMIPHLKYIHILLQKSIKIHCESLKEYAVVTIRQIDKSIQFNIIFYLPKLQKTYSVNLQRSVMKYISKSQLIMIFQGRQPSAKDIEKQFFMNFGEPDKRQRQGQTWNRFVSLFKFETQHYEDSIIILLKIGTYTAFLKDSSFSEYFELKRKIFHLQMSVSKKSGLLAPTCNSKNKILTSSKRKSSSSKDIINNFNDSASGFIKRSGRVLKKVKEKHPSESIVFRKAEIFQRLNQIYESDANKYIIFLSLTQVHQIKNEEPEQLMKETKKINYSFYLSDLIGLLRDSKKELSNQEEKINNEFNEEIFSFAILLRAMTIIKYRIIEKLKEVQVEQLFEGSKRILNQKIFKNKLNSALNSQTDSVYSLNACKRLHTHQNNIYILHKNIMNVSKGIIVSIFYDERSEKITFLITSNHELTNKQKIFHIKDMHFPWIEFYKKEHLFKVNSRLYYYYKNILLFI